MTPITLPAMIPIDEFLPSTDSLADIIIVEVFIEDISVILFKSAVEEDVNNMLVLLVDISGFNVEVTSTLLLEELELSIVVIAPEVFMVGMAVLLLVLVETGLEL